MSKYIVRVRKCEIVVLAADVRIEADSADAARVEVQTRIERCEEIDDRLWYEGDAWDTREPVMIQAVWPDVDS